MYTDILKLGTKKQVILSQNGTKLKNLANVDRLQVSLWKDVQHVCYKIQMKVAMRYH